MDRAPENITPEPGMRFLHGHQVTDTAAGDRRPETCEVRRPPRGGLLPGLLWLPVPGTRGGIRRLRAGMAPRIRCSRRRAWPARPRGFRAAHGSPGPLHGRAGLCAGRPRVPVRRQGEPRPRGAARALRSLRPVLAGGGRALRWPDHGGRARQRQGNAAAARRGVRTGRRAGLPPDGGRRAGPGARAVTAPQTAITIRERQRR